MQPSLMPKPANSGGGHLDLSRIAQDLQIRKVQVENVVQLLDEGNTVPFITRYRKERTGGLHEELIRTVQARVEQLRQLAERKQTILKSIEGQGKLNDELQAAILAADTPRRLEDLYLPFKPKKRTLATAARERGLEPLAQAIWNRDPAVTNLAEMLPTLVDSEKELPTPEDVLQGVQHILAEDIADMAAVRGAVRNLLWDASKLAASKHEKLAENEGLDFKDYFKFSESVRHIPPHRILAINRGEKENALQVKLEWDLEIVQRVALEKLALADHPHVELLKQVATDALTRLLLPSIEREIRRELSTKAQGHAVSVFARNLRSLLLMPPLRGRRVLAVDPAFRTGCKVAALDEVGGLLEESVIFPHRPQNKRHEAKLKLEEMIRKYRLSVIAIGNGTACRETEEVAAELIADLEKRRKEGPPTVESPAAAPVDVSTPNSDAAPTSSEATAVSPVPPATVPEATAATNEPQPASTEGHATAPEAQASGNEPPASTAEQPALKVEEASALPAGTTEGISAEQADKVETGSHAPAGRKPETPSITAASLAGLPEAPADIAYVIVNEAGASVYSASPVGREEFPQFDATTRGTISIGRRLQDPLSELVKIDPQHVGVGLYQHDVHPRQLKESLDAVVESCVNQVGVDLNTASVPLLRHVSGLNQLVARELTEYRKQHGSFKSREELLQVAGVGPARYVQAAGFLKISDGADPLDETWIHPESYAAARQLLADVGYSPDALREKQRLEDLREKLKTLPLEEVATRLQIGLPTLQDILDALAKPGRDPRDDLPPPIFKKGILKLEDLQPGAELKGTVLNVVDFGAFVDIGLKDSGLVHISQMANRYVKSPYDIVAVGDVVTIWVLSVDRERRRVSLTMIQPGTERKPPEKKPFPPRPERPSRPPRSRQPVQAGSAVAASSATATGGGSRRSATPHPVGARSPAPTAPPPRPRRPQRSAPKPKLSQAALQGDAPLRTFSELAAFLEAKQKPTPEPTAPTPPPAASSNAEETPPPSPPE